MKLEVVHEGGDGCGEGGGGGGRFLTCRCIVGFSGLCPLSYR